MNIFNKIGNWISKTWKDGMEIFKSKGIPVSVTVVNVLKQVVESGAGDFLVNLTKTNLDNAVLEDLKNWLPKIAMELAVSDIVIKAGATDSEIMAALIAWLTAQNISVKATFYAGIAAKINQALADGKLTMAEALSLGQYFYNHYNN